MNQSMINTPGELEPRSNEGPIPMPPCLSMGIKAVETVLADIRPESRVVVLSDPFSMEADRFRTLKVHLGRVAKSADLKTLMVTSAVIGEGKTVSSLNLAAALAERNGGKVILVEADLRNPMLLRTIGLETWPGLVRCLSEATDPLHHLKRVDPLGCYLLPAGDVCLHPIQLLNSDRFAAILARLRSLGDWVILDCPPVLPVPDALAIRNCIDGCLWVVRSEVTPRDVVEEAMNKLGRDSIYGVLLNNVAAAEEIYPSYYYHHGPLMLGPGSPI